MRCVGEIRSIPLLASRKPLLTLLLFLITLLFGCTSTKPILVDEEGIVADNAMVVTAHPLASKVGINRRKPLSAMRDTVEVLRSRCNLR